MLLQQFSNHRIRCLLVTQRSDGVMEWLEIAERDTMRVRPELLNRLVQRFEIGRWFGCSWCVHNLWMLWLKSSGEHPANRSRDAASDALRTITGLLHDRLAGRPASFGADMRVRVASYLASHLDGHAAVLPLSLSGHYWEIARI